MNDCAIIIKQLREAANPANVAGMARFGINSDNTLGVSIPALREIARAHRKQHPLALELWQTGIHEARILASMVADPGQVTPELMDRWTSEFDSWDTCDQVCANLWEKTPYAYEKALEWSRAEGEFIKRAGFVLMARLAVGNKMVSDAGLAEFLPHLLRGAADERNLVKKAVNWALRQIGKRSIALNALAITTGEEMTTLNNKAARWIAADALRELRSEAVKNRLSGKSNTL
jgi:3-methyladenine DNA glycosylase AlkD